MRKIKLVFVKSFIEYPTSRDTFSRDIEVSSPGDIDDFRLIGARIYYPEQGKSDVPASGDINIHILEHSDGQKLLGRLLTYVDATFTDPEQRKAHKDIIRDIYYDWDEKMRQRDIQTVDSQETTEPIKS